MHKLLIFAMHCLLVPLFAQTLPTGLTNLPIVKINTNGGKISSDPEILADLGITDYPDGNLFSEAPNNYSGKVLIQLRGFSSLQFDKKSYSIELVDAQGVESKASLMGMPEESDWTLTASYNDKTQIRNAFGYVTARATGHYAPRTRLCELILNGSYEGTYLFTEKISRDSLRVDVSKLDDDDNSGDSLTGGYILRIDHPEDGNGWQSTLNSRVYYQYYYPKDSKITTAQSTYIRTYIKNFEEMMESSRFADSAVGYPKWISEMSFVDFILQQELVRNVDAYRLSAYLHKDNEKFGKGGKLHAGPVWDMDISTGNANYYNGWSPTGWVYKEPIYGDNYQRPSWWERLADEPKFHQLMNCRWKGLRHESWSDTRLLGTFDSLRTLIETAQTRNFSRWKILSSWVYPNKYIGGSWTAEIDSMRSFIIQRVAWMDQEFSAPCADTLFTGIQKPASTPHRIHNFQIKGRIMEWKTPPASLHFYDLRGRLAYSPKVSATINLSRLAAGTFLVVWQERQGSLRQSRLIRL